MVHLNGIMGPKSYFAQIWSCGSVWTYGSMANASGPNVGGGREMKLTHSVIFINQMFDAHVKFC